MYKNKNKGPQKPKKTRLRRKKKICEFCKGKYYPDFKDVVLLRGYITDRGKIQAQRNTGACATHQRALSQCIKRARHAGLIPYAII